MVIYATPVFAFDLPGAFVGGVIGGLAGLVMWGVARLARYLGGRLGWVSRQQPHADAPPVDEPAAVPDIRDLNGGKAVASLVLGCVGLVGWCLPILGLPLTITGLALGIKGLRSQHHGLAVAGVTLSLVGLALSVANAALGAYLASIGQHPLVR